MQFPSFIRKIRPLIFVLLCSTQLPPARGETYCVDYQYFPNTNNFRVFDFSILSPYAQVDLREGHQFGHRFYAYISAGEVAGNAQYYQAARDAGIPFIGDNPNWDSKVVDLASPLWAPFVVNQLARPAVTQGYDGFFLDTMDSYYLSSGSWSAQEAGLVNLVRALKTAYPSKRVIINRGFPVFDRLRDFVDGMMVEGLFYSWGGTQQDKGGHDWLMGQLAPVKAAGKPVYILDYLPEASSALGDQVASQIDQLGFVPLLVHNDLDGTVVAPHPTPKIEQLCLKDGKPCLRFTAMCMRNYVVEYSDLFDSAWAPLMNVPATATARLVELVDALGAANPTRFYRLKSDGPSYGQAAAP